MPLAEKGGGRGGGEEEEVNEMEEEEKADEEESRSSYPAGHRLVVLEVEGESGLMCIRTHSYKYSATWIGKMSVCLSLFSGSP